MDAAVLERIFDPYFTTKETGEGTGLGLAVVQGIVKSYSGAITVYSEPGIGTTFNVYFPRIEEGIPFEAEAIELLTGGNERILFIDDEKVLTDMAKEMLRSLGYYVTTRTSSIEALEAFRDHPEEFDLVITDMTMPGMTGIELAREIMIIRPDIPIILCTGFSELTNEKRAKEAGIREFILKPYVITSLTKTIRQVLEQK
jgi:CheY-like chemotaxis protein